MFVLKRNALILFDYILLTRVWVLIVTVQLNVYTSLLNDLRHLFGVDFDTFDIQKETVYTCLYFFMCTINLPEFRFISP